MRHNGTGRWKGCCMMCAAWIRGDGKGRRMKVSDLRRSGGRRAVKRKDWDRG